MKKVKNLMIGTSISGNGGIAAHLSVLKNGGFFEKHNILFVPTHTQSKGPLGINALYVFCKALFSIVFYHAIYNISIVHVHSASRLSFKRKSLVVRLCKKLGSKVVLHLHGGLFDRFYEHECGPRQQRSVRRVFNLADNVVVLSSRWLNWVQKILENPEKAVIIYNTVPPAIVDVSKRQPCQILFMGNISYQKGVDDLISAFSMIAEKVPRAKIVLAGDGDLEPYKQRIRRLKLDAQFIFPGWISGKEKQRWLESSGIFVLPSYFEGMPMSVLEAMAAGLPVITTDVGGIPDAIKNGREGIVIKPGEIEQLASALLHLLIADEDREKMSAMAREKYYSHFTNEAVFPKLSQIYARLSAL